MKQDKSFVEKRALMWHHHFNCMTPMQLNLVACMFLHLSVKLTFYSSARKRS